MKLEPVLQEKFPEGIDAASGSAYPCRAGWPERLKPTCIDLTIV